MGPLGVFDFMGVLKHLNIYYKKSHARIEEIPEIRRIDNDKGLLACVSNITSTDIMEYLRKLYTITK